MTLAQIDNITRLIPVDTPQTVPTARAFQMRSRHWALVASFCLFVVVPSCLCAWYLYARALDQYASIVAFSVRSENQPTSLELIGGIADFSGAGAKDSDILHHYLTSQDIIETVDKKLNLRQLWSGSEGDPVFSFPSAGSIEDLISYWKDMVIISHDPAQGLIEIQSRAFSANDARRINVELLHASEELINRINNVAQTDTVTYALVDLDQTKEKLSKARSALTEFRTRHQLIDPGIEAQTLSSLVTSLEAQRIETKVDIELLTARTRADDPRLEQALVREAILEKRIAALRNRHSVQGDQHSAKVMGAFETLRVEVEFAEQSYQTARAAFDAAVSQAKRNTRYLAAHIQPTLSQVAQFPDKSMILSIVLFGSFLIWALAAMVFLSFLDRR